MRAGGSTAGIDLDDLQLDVASGGLPDLLAGGALIVGFSMTGALPESAAAARGVVAGPPDPNAIDSWIAVHADNTATVYFGKCELGQGNTTGMLQIAGEELDLDMSQLRAAPLDTNVTPNQGATSSSSSIHRGGPQLRAAAAEARQALLTLAVSQKGSADQQLAITITKTKSDIASANAKVNQAAAALKYARANTAQNPAYEQNVAALDKPEYSSAALKAAQAKKAST